VQRLIFNAWRRDYFDHDRLTRKAAAVARNLFRTSAIETLSLDPRLSQDFSSFESRYEAFEGILVEDRAGRVTNQTPLKDYFRRLFDSMQYVQSFKIILAPGGFLASKDNRVVDLLQSYAIHHDVHSMMLKLRNAGLVNDVNESRFFRSAISPGPTIERDPFLGINAERISCRHRKLFDKSTHYDLTEGDIPEKNFRDVIRLPLLSYLASRPGTRCMSYFLEHPDCNWDVQDENGWTPLIWAARYSSIDFVSAVLTDYDEPLCDVNYSDPNGWTAFEHAAAFFDTGTMSMILAAKAFDHNAVDSNGRPRLLRAIENCDFTLAEMLLKERGCDPNVPDDEGRTPLTLSVSECQAAPDSKDSTTVSRMQPNVALPEVSERSDSIHQALIQTTKRAFEYKELVALLLRRPDINVNLQDSSGRSALMIASALGSVDVVKLLLQVEGCDPNLVSPNGDTVHSLAHGSGNLKVVRLLEQFATRYHDRRF
jgi:ankyrin repeat protein